MVALNDLLTSRYAPIQNSILSNLRAGEVIALTKTCKAFAELWPTVKATDYNINLRLRKIFKDPREFRSVQDQCNALIMGCEARASLARSEDTLFDLAITVGHEANATLTAYLEAEGYVLDEASMSAEDWTAPWTCYINCENRIIVNSNVSALYGVLEYARSTADLNFLSWNKAFSLYPYATYVEKEAFMLMESSEENVEDWAGYLNDIEIRTLTLEEDAEAADQRSLVVGRRRVGDKATWVVELDAEGVQDPGRSDEILESSTFEVRLYESPYDGAEEEIPRYKVDSKMLEPPNLRNIFIAALEHRDHLAGRKTSQFRQRCLDLFDHLDGVTLLELTKIPKSQRPPEYIQLLNKTTTATELKDEVAELLTTSWNEQLAIDAEEECLEQERLKQERLEAERIKTERLQNERIEQERKEREESVRREANKREATRQEIVQREHMQTTKQLLFFGIMIFVVWAALLEQVEDLHQKGRWSW